MPEHVDIVDGERHEPKGASTAVAGQVLKSLGGGATSFGSVDYSEISNTPTPTLSQTDGIFKASFVDQLLADVGDTLTVEYGTLETSPGGSVTVATDGNITFNQDGVYFVRFELFPGRTSSGSVSTLFFRLINDGVPGTARSITIDDAGGNQTMGFVESEVAFIPAGTVLSIELLKDVDGGGSAGLVTVTATTAGWGTAPSAVLAVNKFEVV